MEIRKLTAADAAAYKELLVRSLKEYPDSFGADPVLLAAQPLADFEERLRAANQSPGYFTLGAFDPQLVGRATLRQHEPPNERHQAHISGVYVVPEAQRHGIARTLMMEMIALAGAVEEIDHLRLVVNHSNSAARDLYASLGFETCGIEQRDIRNVNGDYLDGEIMVLWLRERPAQRVRVIIELRFATRKAGRIAQGY